jgi:hypothetical protein
MLLVMPLYVALAEIKAGEPNIFTGLVSTLFPPSRIFQWDAGNEPGPEQSLKHAAKSTGRSYMEVYYDWLVPPDGDEPGVLWKPLQAYQDGDFENLRSIHEHPLTVPGVSGMSKRSGEGCMHELAFFSVVVRLHRKLTIICMSCFALVLARSRCWRALFHFSRWLHAQPLADSLGKRSQSRLEAAVGARR